MSRTSWCVSASLPLAMMTTRSTARPRLTVGTVGSGNIAKAIGLRLAERGHAILIGGRSPERAMRTAREVGHGAVAVALTQAIHDVDAVLWAVPWTSVDDVLTELGADRGSLDGVVLVDPTNPVIHGVGTHRLPSGSAAQHIADRAIGAHVVKGFNVHPASFWANATPDDTVLLAGNAPKAVETVSNLVRDVGATPHFVGDLNRARQIEELAGTVISLAFAGLQPRSAVPS